MTVPRLKRSTQKPSNTTTLDSRSVNRQESIDEVLATVRRLPGRSIYRIDQAVHVPRLHSTLRLPDILGHLEEVGAIRTEPGDKIRTLLPCIAGTWLTHAEHLVGVIGPEENQFPIEVPGEVCAIPVPEAGCSGRTKKRYGTNPSSR